MPFQYAQTHDGPEAGKIEVEGHEVTRTTKGLLWDNGNGHQEWLPLRQVRVGKGGTSVLMPPWLAKKVGYW